MDVCVLPSIDSSIAKRSSVHHRGILLAGVLSSIFLTMIFDLLLYLKQKPRNSSLPLIFTSCDMVGLIDNDETCSSDSNILMSSCNVAAAAVVVFLDD